MVVLIDNPRGPKMVLLYGPPRGLASQVCSHLAEMVLLYAPPPPTWPRSHKNTMAEMDLLHGSPRFHTLANTSAETVLLYGSPRGHALAPRGHTLAKTLWRKWIFYMAPHVA